MAEPGARQRRREERRRLILDAARARADADGWSAVTTRHLADAIGYTQPVLYGHFPGGKTEIMRAVALEGFTDLAQRCRRAAEDGLEAVALAYLDFAADHPALYEAMFQLPIEARFAEEGNEPELRSAFDALAEAVGDDGDGTVTEVFWGALHGIGLLESAGRMRTSHRRLRVTELARLLGRAQEDWATLGKQE